MKRANKKNSKKGLWLRKNKKFYGAFVGLFALVILVNATLAWSSYTEWVKNHTQSDPESIAVRITEVFQQDSVLSYTTPVEKSVKVKNISNKKAIIRVKFNESFLPFIINMEDGEEAGQVQTFLMTTEDEVNPNNISTWNVGNLYDSGRTDSSSNKLYYKATNTILKNVAYTGEANRSSGPAELRYFTWTFNPDVSTTGTIPGNPTPYWVYIDGYFYYSQVVEGGNTTAIDLLQEVALANVSIPNKHKNALYDIQIDAEGVTPNSASVASWTSNASILAMYREDPNFG